MDQLPTQSTRPTILVKKSDGTFARMTLDEVKKMQSGAQKSAGVSNSAMQSKETNSKIQDTNTKDANIKKQETRSTATPVKPQGAPIPKLLPSPQKNNLRPAPAPVAPKAAKEDFAAPLEDLPASASPAPRMAVTREDQAEAIVKKLSFPVAPEARNRLRTAIQLRLKDVRTDDQTKSVLVRPLKDGGAGLTKEQGDEVIKKLESGIGLSRLASTVIPTGATPQERSGGISFNRQARSLDSVPSRDSARDDNEARSAEIKPVQPAVPFKLASEPQPRAAVHDVLPPAEHEVGPIEEIRLFTLTDFRRLSTNPKEAASRLRQKFFNLKDESILLYLDALSAWRASPLYQAYVTAIASALAKKQTLAAAVGDKNSIQLPEIKVVVEMENTLEYL